MFGKFIEFALTWKIEGKILARKAWLKETDRFFAFGFIVSIRFYSTSYNRISERYKKPVIIIPVESPRTLSLVHRVYNSSV